VVMPFECEVNEEPNEKSGRQAYTCENDKDVHDTQLS
jgi:hypothetical protein